MSTQQDEKPLTVRAVPGVRFTSDGSDTHAMATGPYTEVEQILVGTARVIASRRRVRRIVVTVEPDPDGGPYSLLIEECPETKRVRARRCKGIGS